MARGLAPLRGVVSKALDAPLNPSPLTPPSFPSKQKRSIDRVLVDAPCSGVGAWRRNPDSRWLASPDLPSLLALQVYALLYRFPSEALFCGEVIESNQFRNQRFDLRVVMT